MVNSLRGYLLWVVQVASHRASYNQSTGSDGWMRFSIPSRLAQLCGFRALRGYLLFFETEQLGFVRQSSPWGQVLSFWSFFQSAP